MCAFVRVKSVIPVCQYFSEMRLSNNNVESMPIDMVMLLMQYLLTFGFESVFNFFIAWCRTQRPPTIHMLLEGFPLRSLYKFCHMGSSADKACLDRFFRIAANLGFADAIVYRSCRAVLSASRDIDNHISALGAVACGGHYMSLAANFIAQSLYQYEGHEIATALTHLGSLFSSVGCPEDVAEARARPVCPIHPTDINMVPQSNGVVLKGCLFCTILQGGS